MAINPIQITCPQCRKQSIYSTSNPHRPFCSQRCAMIDLGKWANDEYRIADSSTPNSLDEFEQPERHN